MPRKSTDRIITEATALLRDYIRDGRSRTDLLKATAALIVELRSRFTLDDGRTDWSGRSPEYREAIAQVYSGARVPAVHLDTVQAALRYHVGNLLREKASAEELGAVGLTSVSPRDRLQSHRDVINALAASVEQGNKLKKPDLLRLVTHAEALLEGVDLDEVAGMDAARRVGARVSLENILARAQVVLAEVRKAERRLTE